MAALNLSQPPPFLQNVGQPPIPLKAWLRSFENYMLAMSETDLPDARKRALLIHCLGAEGQRLFYTLTVADDKYSTALKAIEDFFIPQVNVVAERYRFRQRSQRPGETTDQFTAALKELVTTCQFGAMEEEMIRDQIVEKTNSTRIRERLLLEVPLTLDKALTIARQIETAVTEARAMHKGATDDAVHTVHVKGPQQHGKFRKGTLKPHSASQRTHGKTCYRCGSAQHTANFQGCPAKEALCNACKKKGHFAKVCRGSKHVSEVETVPEVTILNVNAGDSNRIMVTVEVSVAGSESQNIELMLDTGSKVSILPLSVVTELFHDISLTKPKIKLRDYGGNPIAVKGCLQANVTFGSLSTNKDIYIVYQGSAVLGRDLFSSLRMQVIDGEVFPAPSIQSNSAVESVTVEKLGCAKRFVHKVKVRPDVKPVQQKLRRLPFSVREAVSKELKKLVEQDVIEPVESSEWISPIVVTTRKDRPDPRLCVDLREPNKSVVVDGFPLPHMEEIFTELRGAMLFSTLDLQSAYYQVPLHEDSRSLTTFITHDGLFRFKRVPFGLASGPSCFQRMMSLILKGLKGVQCYLDDIIVSGATAEEHDERLTAVLKRIEDAGLMLNLSKCNFRQTELCFLGHTVSSKGLQPDASHVTAVSKAPPPTDLPKLRSFLGLTSWYSKFIPDYAVVVEPLRTLLRGADTFTWTPEAQRSFETVKRLIVNSPALALFNPALPTVVTTDASDYGLGAVLTQIHQDGTERTVAFASRTLTQAERKYSTVEKEALGCVWATEKWRTYLWGRHFTLRTDHSPLTTLLASKGQGRAGMRIARWSSRLLSFNYDIQYKPGRENVTADCLSRLPLPSSEPILEDDTEVALTSALTAITETEFKAACTSCPVQIKLRELLTSRWPKSAKDLTPDLQPFFKLRHELSLQDDCVVRGTHRLLVPDSLQPKLISLAHDTHQGIVRTKQRLREAYWWPGMDGQVEAAIKACITCQSHDKSAVTHTTPLQPVPYPEQAWEKVAIDVVGPFDRAPIDCRFAITLIDYHSKWPELAFVPRVTSGTVIQFLSAVFSREGDPIELVSDNGSQFVSHEFETFLQDRGIVHRKSSVYYPRANGEIERFNRSLKDSLQTASLEGKPWKEFTRNFLHIYRATPHSTTQRSPAELLHGRPMRTKLQVAGRPLPHSTPLSSRQVAIRVGEKQEKSKTYTDQKRGATAVSFACGSYVRVKKPGILPKTQCKFSKPLKVMERRGKYSYLLSDGRCWNASHLAPASLQGKESDTELLPLDFETKPATPAVPQTAQNTPLARSVRLKRAPEWTKDFVMN